MHGFQGGLQKGNTFDGRMDGWTKYNTGTEGRYACIPKRIRPWTSPRDIGAGQPVRSTSQSVTTTTTTKTKTRNGGGESIHCLATGMVAWTCMNGIPFIWHLANATAVTGEGIILQYQ